MDADSGVLYGVPSLDDLIFQTGPISRDEALRVPAVRRARDLICGEIGQFPLVLIGPDGKTTDWSLLSQPESGVARSVTMTRVVEDMLLFERAWLKTTHVGWHGKPAEVRRLDAQTVTIRPEYVSYPEGTALVWPEVSGIIRLDSPNRGLLTASPAIKACVALERAALRAAQGLPPMDWFTPADGADVLDDDDVMDLLDAWETARGDRRTAYVPGGLEYHRDGFDPEKTQLAESREFAITEVARLTGIDAEELSVSTTSRTYANMQDRRRHRVESVLGPFMTAIEGRLSLGDVTPHGYRVEFDTSGYLRLDDLTAAQADEVLIRSKVLTPDEARAKRGLEPRGEVVDPAPATEPPAEAPRKEAAMSAQFSALSEPSPIQFEAAEFAVDTEKRTLTGILLPFGEVSRPAKDPRTGAAAKFSFAEGTVMVPEDPSEVILNYGHDGESLASQVGVATELSLSAKGVLARFRIARTPEGDRILTLAEDKILKSFSAEVEGEFEPDKSGVMHAKAAILTGGAVVRKPAFAGAHITSVAASAAQARKEPVMGDENTQTIEAPASFSKADGDALAAQFQKMAEDLAALKDIKIPVGPGAAQFEVKEEPIYRFGGTEGAPSGFDFAADLLAAGKDGDGAALKRIQDFTAERLAPTFATTADVNEVNPPQYRPDMFLGQAPIPQSPLYDTFHKGSLSNVTPFFWSKLDRVATTVAVGDHTEGTDPALTNLVTATGATVTPIPVSGRVHITREVADQGGNPQVSGLVWSEFERSLKIALETKTVALLTAAAGSITALGAAIAAGANGNVAGNTIEAGLVDLQFLADGYRFTKAFGHVDLYKALSGAVIPQFSGDTTGVKRYPIINPQNRDGVQGQKYSFIDIAGYRMEPAASLGATSGSASNSYVADPNAVHVWNSGLTRLDKLQEKVEGWDMGVFAYFAGVVYDVTGLRKIAYDPTA